MKTLTKTFSALSALTLIAGSAQAASITYEGVQVDVEAKTNDPTTGWRNATTAKPLDIDGDNILGTDGYYAFSTAILQPTYVTSWGLTAGNNNWSTNTDSWGGLLDNPADPTGADTLPFGRWATPTGVDASIFNFTVNGDLAGQTLTIGLLWGTFADTDATLQLKQTVGGSATATTPAVSTAGDGLDVLYFNVTGAQAGDTFVVIPSDNSVQWMGITFDSAVPEPGSLALLGLGGLLIARRRRG